MADAIDIALAVEQLLGPGVAYGSAATYDDLVRTWEDERWPAPSLAELEAAWDRIDLSKYDRTAVSKRQLMLALWRLRKITESQIKLALADDPEALIEWNATSTIERHKPSVNRAGQRLGFDADALDALFDYAATL